MITLKNVLAFKERLGIPSMENDTIKYQIEFISLNYIDKLDYDNLTKQTLKYFFATAPKKDVEIVYQSLVNDNIKLYNFSLNKSINSLAVGGEAYKYVTENIDLSQVEENDTFSDYVNHLFYDFIIDKYNITEELFDKLYLEAPGVILYEFYPAVETKNFIKSVADFLSDKYNITEALFDKLYFEDNDFINSVDDIVLTLDGEEITVNDGIVYHNDIKIELSIDGNQLNVVLEAPDGEQISDVLYFDELNSDAISEFVSNLIGQLYESIDELNSEEDEDFDESEEDETFTEWDLESLEDELVVNGESLYAEDGIFTMEDGTDIIFEVMSGLLQITVGAETYNFTTSFINPNKPLIVTYQTLVEGILNGDYSEDFEDDSYDEAIDKIELHTGVFLRENSNELELEYRKKDGMTHYVVLEDKNVLSDLGYDDDDISVVIQEIKDGEKLSDSKQTILNEILTELFGKKTEYLSKYVYGYDTWTVSDNIHLVITDEFLTLNSDTDDMVTGSASIKNIQEIVDLIKDAEKYPLPINPQNM